MRKLIAVSRSLAIAVCVLTAFFGCAASPQVDPAALFRMSEDETLPTEQRLDFLRKAAEADYGPAQFRLAYSYWHGSGPFRLDLARDYRLAERWALRHVNNPTHHKDVDPQREDIERTRSMGVLAWMYFHGQVGKAPNYVAARKWAENGGYRSREGPFVMWKLYEDGLGGLERDKLKAEYWKLRFQNPDHPLALLGSPHWTFERMLLSSEYVLVGRVERIENLGWRMMGTGPVFNLLEADVVIEEVVYKRETAAALGKTIKVVLGGEGNRDKVEREFLGRPLVFPVGHTSSPFSRRADDPKKNLRYNRLLMDTVRDAPLALDRLPEIRSTLARIVELGFDRP